MNLIDRVMVVAVTGFVALGLTTLALAVAGLARPLPVFVVAAAGWVALLALWRQGSTAAPSTALPSPRPSPRLWVVALGCLVVVGSGASNLRHQGQHVLSNRDPGIYLNGARWIAEHGNLVVDGGAEAVPGLDDLNEVMAAGAGQTETDGDPDRIQIQGAHLFHSVLAVGQWVAGPTGFSAMPALIGVLALAVFFWLALRLLPDWLALVATVALAANFAWIYTVRSYLSEPTLLLLSFAGAALLLNAAESWPHRPGRMVVAGLVAGTALTARVDAGVVILAFPLLVVLSVSRRGGGSRPGRSLAWWCLGAAGPAALAAVDLAWRAPRYLSDLGSEVTMVVVGLVAAVVSALVLAAASGVPAVAAAAQRIGAGLAPHRRNLAAVAAGLVVVVAAFAWFVRPHLGPDRVVRDGAPQMEAIQVNEGLEPDGNRTYAERSLDRITWYTGPVAVAAGAAGLALLARRLVLGRIADVELVVAGLVTPCLVLYAYAPSIYSDHPWMIRRFVPTAIPGLLLFAGVAVAALVRWPRLPRAAGMVVASVSVAGLIAGPLRMTLPLRSVSWQAGGRDGIERLCASLGTGEVVLFASEGGTGLLLLPATHSFCDVDAVGLAPHLTAVTGAPVAAEVATMVGAAGRDLQVVGPTREAVLALAPDAVRLRPVKVLQTSGVGTTIGRPPHAVGDVALVVWVGTVEAPVGA